MRHHTCVVKGCRADGLYIAHTVAGTTVHLCDTHWGEAALGQHPQLKVEA